MSAKVMAPPAQQPSFSITRPASDETEINPIYYEIPTVKCHIPKDNVMIIG